MVQEMCAHRKNSTLDFEFQSLAGLAMINSVSTVSCCVWQRQTAVARSQPHDGEGKLLMRYLDSVPSCKVEPGILEGFQLRALPTKNGE